ncbi:Methylmalonate-semialdehyde dehydrogenase [Penicillium chrysogenum]|uniref:methylmalonate-semialdehyde dehydrogenase (CoA acylating) n=1 Tax=Penicillium chrysogenum TaxID=5076 RepID=A0ABQ8WR48_PENCH|nr:Methylmalonate-semialdehyde dehydrogenase [Penicillium chrysogenum]KAJ6156667.1 Methylmalonate-semialdehyde dehydrogenase [Penicillium chrysogenum]
MATNTAGTASTDSTVRMTHAPIVSPADTPNFLDNEFVPSKATQWIPVYDPATNNLVTRVPQSTAEELSIAENWDRLAASITLEQGKTFNDARGDVIRGLQVAETACGITTQLPGEVLEVARDMETRSYREPLGVVAAICPFNFPAMIPLWCIPIAVVTGNTLILKPSERDPGAALILAELAREAGLPNGVLNIVHGAVDTVNFIIEEPAIRAISFVGSNRAGEYIYSRGSANGKRVQANLGAKNHAVLLPDADKETALNAIAGAAFGAAGQRCMALSVLVTVGESSSYIPEVVEKARKLVVSAGFEKDADVGPVISPESRRRIESLIARAELEGASILLDGRGCKPEKYPQGNFVAPTVITNVNTNMACYKEEIFGPVLVCISVQTLEEAVDLLNANEYGNGASIFTKSGSSASYFQKNIEAGQVGINVAIPVPLPMFSFTGNKKSIAGGGANTFYGKPGLAFYTQQKTVTSLWRRENVHSGKQVVMPSHL